MNIAYFKSHYPHWSDAKMKRLGAIDRGDFWEVTPAQAARLHKRKLGDWVEILLAPFVRWSDRRLGTKLTGCAACARRKTRLNRFHDRLHDLF